ncbi:hypothetical protein Tco_0205760 [Tanacetum coccineum]
MAVIWNPTVRKSVGIVIPISKAVDIVVGFGVCPDTSDPKLVKITDDEINCLILFDLKSEKFGEVCLPKRLVRAYLLKETKVNESLGLLEYYVEGQDFVCGVWTRKDGANKPFTKIYTVKVECKSMYDRVLGFRNNDEVVMELVSTKYVLGWKDRSGWLLDWANGAITDIKCALTQKARDAFCTKNHIPDEVHPVLPNQNDTMHKRPAGKIGLYTRFFDYANFRLPLSVFLVDVLRHFRINISQLSVIGAAKVSYFEILCRIYGVIPTVGLFRCFYVNSKKNGWMSFSKRFDNAATCYTKPLDSLKNLNDHFFWVDDFACPASFPWHTAKNKFPEAFLCFVGLSWYYPLDEDTYPRFLHKNGEDMYIFALIHTLVPTKVKIVERERNEDEPLLLQTTVGRAVPLLPVAPDRAESELEASVDRLFNKGVSGNQMEQGGSTCSGGDANIQLVSEATGTVAENVAPLLPRRQRKRKTMVVDANGASHPPKKLREDHGTPSGPSVAGKSRSAVQRLLAGAVLNTEVRGEAIPTLPFVTSSVSATSERKGGDHTDFVVGHNLCTIGASQRFVISSDSSHHSGPTIGEAEVDSLARSSIPLMTTVTTVTVMVDPTLVVKEKTAKPSLFSTDSSSAGGADPNTGVFSDLSGSDFLVGSIHTVIDLDTDLQKVYVPQWSVTNGSCLNDSRICHEMVDEFAPPKFFTSVRGMKHDQLFTKFNVRAARQMSLSAEVRMRAEYNVKERRREAEAAEAIRLRAEASNFETVEKSLRDEVNALKERNTILEKERTTLDVKVMDLEALVVHELELSSFGLQEKVTVYKDCMGQLEKFQDERMKEVNDKFDKMYADFIEMALHLEDRFYPYLLTTISDRRWLLTHGMELAITKCLHSPEYISALRGAIGKATEKGMQDRLSAGITHGTKGRALTDVATYNPSAEADYISALKHLQNVNFSLLAELRSNKDASVDTLMNILRLEETLAERLGLTESQPHADQLVVPIHHSPDKVVFGATALSLALDVSNIRVRRIRENNENQRSALHDVFVPLSEPFSAEVLMGAEGTSDIVSTTGPITTTLSTTFACTGSIAPISVDDYEVAGTDDQVGTDDHATPFPNVDDAELNIP